MAQKKTSKKAPATDDDPVVKELADIKRLMVFALLRDGASQSDVAAALGVSQPSVSRMFPVGSTITKKPKG